jgi:transcription-repair coupling factor (superfamily II helicase)
MLRLQIYKKISMIQNQEDERELTDELIDRFGDIPRDTLNLIKISKIRAMAESMGIKEISQQRYKIIFSLWENVKLSQTVMARLIGEYGEKMMLGGGREPYIRLTINRDDPLKSIEKFLETALTEKKLN